MSATDGLMLLAVLFVLMGVIGAALVGLTKLVERLVLWLADETPPRSRSAQIADELARRRALRAVNKGAPLTKPEREARRDAFKEFAK